MILKNLSSFGYIKSRPKSYRSDGMSVGGHKGYVLSAYPRSYPLTRQQVRVRDAARACGIRKGIDRGTLRRAMTECIPQQFGK